MILLFLSWNEKNIFFEIHKPEGPCLDSLLSRLSETLQTRSFTILIFMTSLLNINDVINHDCSDTLLRYVKLYQRLIITSTTQSKWRYNPPFQNLMGFPQPLFKTCYKLRTNTFSLSNISVVPPSLYIFCFLILIKIETAILFVSDLKLTLYMFYSNQKRTVFQNGQFTHSPLPLPNIIEFNPLYKLNITSIGEARKEERFNQN